MKWIVITMPTSIENEALYVNQLFEMGIDLLHLRKPNAQKEDCEKLLQQISPKWYPQIVVHDHFELCEKYRLHGIHLNKRNHTIPQGFQGSISRSCHSLEEVKQADGKFDYVFLSPIFDSISKEGYKHSFSNQQLEDAAKESIINSKVIALGGITAASISQLKKWNFGGAAFLGDIWNRRCQLDWEKNLTAIKENLSSDI